MSGENEYLTSANKKVEKTREGMERYENQIGLPKFPAEHIECEYINLKSDDILKLSPEQCGAIASELANYSIYINRLISRERSLVNWLESKINLTIAPELNSYSGSYSFDQRRTVAIVNNRYAKELEELRINAQVKLDLLDGLTYQINLLCKTLSDNQINKRQQNKNY